MLADFQPTFASGQNRNMTGCIIPGMTTNKQHRREKQIATKVTEDLPDQNPRDGSIRYSIWGQNGSISRQQETAVQMAGMRTLQNREGRSKPTNYLGRQLGLVFLVITGEYGV